MGDLLGKYNVPGPRYTSYPTVPYWSNPPSEEEWKKHVKASFDAYNTKDGISIYIHLPYCESLCTFCGCNTRITVNHGVEEPYIETLLMEWTLYTDLFEERPLIKEIHLGGGTPTFFSPANLTKLIQGISARGTIAQDADLSIEASPKSTTREHLATLYQLGFRRLSLGIQDFDPLVQKTINRVQTFGQIKAVTDWARTIGFESVNYDLVYGLPFQNMSSIEQTIDLVNLLRPDRIAYYSYAHIPWVKPGQRSFTEKDLPDGELKHQMYAEGKRMLVEAGYTEIGMDHFALPGEALAQAFRSRRLHRNFMGYTTQPSKLMIGLGVSSIGDTWTAFGQNLKVVEAYTEAVHSGRFPIFRGHILSEEDLRMRALILDIMCHFRTDLKHVAGDATEWSEGSLEEMERDRLIRRNGSDLEVTSKGRPYVRNICMAFDLHLLRNKPDTQIFSMTV
jgi:oxygen-independent coproporphyrinogen-3 oxidase